MAPLLLLGSLALSIGVIVSTARLLHRSGVGAWWWSAFSLLLLAGLVVGVAASNWDRQVSPTLRFMGWPLPMVIFQLEQGAWFDYVHPPIVAVGILAVNVLLVAGGALLPLSVVVWVSVRRNKRGFDTES
jgi:hypothetical protein